MNKHAMPQMSARPPVFATAALPPDVAVRWETAYRAMIAEFDSWFAEQSLNDGEAELLFLAEQEIINEAMRLVYARLSGAETSDSRRQYLQKTPDPVPAWMQAARLVRSALGLRESYVPPALFRPERDICTFHRCAISAAYAKQRGVRPKLMSAGDWFAAPGATAKGFEGLAAAPLAVVSRAFDAACRAAQVETAVDAAQERFQEFARLIAFWRNDLRRWKKLPGEFWTSTMGYPVHRVFAHAIRKAGGTVIGFDHGSGSGMWASDFQTRIELGFVDRFTTFAPAMAAGLEKNIALAGKRFAGVTVEPLAGLRPSPVARRTRHEKPRTAIYVPAAYAGDKFMSPPLYDNGRMVDWQWRLLKALGEQGLKVAIKPHPESTQEPAECFQHELGVDVIKGRFEDVAWDDAVFIFDTPESSAFSLALATGMPVVVFDLPRLRVRPEARAMMARRVAFTPVWIDEAERMQTDWADLPDAIAKSLALDDNEVLRRYFGMAV